jgi:tetratricopeptide (TPR) repeat protein
MNRKERRAARGQGRAEPSPNGWALNDLGNALVAQGRIDEAFRHYERALHLLPDAPVVLCNMGNVRATQGRRAEAAKLYERALALEPRDSAANGVKLDRARVLLNLGNLRRELGQLEQAATPTDAHSSYDRSMPKPAIISVVCCSRSGARRRRRNASGAPWS